ncbi:MAG: hypothetical protein IAF94_02220, partial [Pirellulaceae bacterium]|nr:hypothetical protein [Pirellulaceae bacterium]
EALAQAARRCLEAFPDDMEALRLLIEHHRRRDEPEDMLRLVQHARVVQPLDTRLIGDEYWARLGHARHLALGGQYDGARAELARGDELFPDEAHGFRMLARRAVLEHKAGQACRAEDFARQARGTLDEPMAVWLALSIESVRYELPSRLRRQFQDAWQAAVCRKTTSETAGLVADMLLAYQVLGISYTGHSQQIGEVVEYLHRTTRTKYREKDLKSACLFLQRLREQHELLGKLVRKGLKSFPKSPVFYCLAMEQEIGKGPGACSFSKAKKHAQTALRLAETSTEPADQALAVDLKRQLLMLDDMARAMPALSPFGGRGSGPGLDILDMIKGMMGPLGDGEEDAEEKDSFDHEYDFFFDKPRGRRPPSHAPRKRK